MENQTCWNHLAKMAIYDNEAFIKLYNHFFTIVYKDIFFKTQSKEISDELINTIFWKTFNNLEIFDDSKASFYTWIMSITRNEILMYFRSNKKKIENEVPLEEDFEICRESFNEPEEKVLQEEESFKLKAAIQRLNEREQKILTLKYWLDFSNSEIAKTFDITTENVRVILNRAREKLKKFLSEEN